MNEKIAVKSMACLFKRFLGKRRQAEGDRS